MGLDALLVRLEYRVVTPVTADVTPDVTPKPAPIEACTSVTPVTAENHDAASAAAEKAAAEVTNTALAFDTLPDPAMEARRQCVLAMLAERPGIRYAVMVDNPDTDPVILALAIRGRATCELQIPRAKYDPWLLLDLIEISYLPEAAVRSTNGGKASGYRSLAPAGGTSVAGQLPIIVSA